MKSMYFYLVLAIFVILWIANKSIIWMMRSIARKADDLVAFHPAWLRFFITAWKWNLSYENTAFIATHNGTIVVVDCNGNEIAELCAPDPIEKFDVEDGMILFEQRDGMHSCLLSNISWHGSYKTISLPKSSDYPFQVWTYWKNFLLVVNTPIRKHFVRVIPNLIWTVSLIATVIYIIIAFWLT